MSNEISRAVVAGKEAGVARGSTKEKIEPFFERTAEDESIGIEKWGGAGERTFDLGFGRDDLEGPERFLQDDARDAEQARILRSFNWSGYVVSTSFRVTERSQDSMGTHRRACSRQTRP